MHTAHFAKRVLRRLGAELIGRERILAAQAFELLRRHDQMQEALHAAERAVAIDGVGEIAGDAEAHPPAVTAAFVGLHR
jgi:hypothetical protein